MAVTVTNSSRQPRAFALGPIKAQIVEISAASAANSGTVTADKLTSIEHILLPSTFTHTAAPTFSGNVATLAFSVPTSTAATLIVQDLTYTADALDNTGNLISVAYTGGANAGSEVVTVTGNAISVQIQTGVSTATQVKTAVDASAPASALISVTVSGVGATAQVTATAAFLAGGITGGAVGSALCLGR